MTPDSLTSAVSAPAPGERSSASMSTQTTANAPRTASYRAAGEPPLLGLGHSRKGASGCLPSAGGYEGAGDGVSRKRLSARTPSAWQPEADGVGGVARRSPVRRGCPAGALMVRPRHPQSLEAGRSGVPSTASRRTAQRHHVRCTNAEAPPVVADPGCFDWVRQRLAGRGLAGREPSGTATASPPPRTTGRWHMTPSSDDTPAATSRR